MRDLVSLLKRKQRRGEGKAREEGESGSEAHCHETPVCTLDMTAKEQQNSLGSRQPILEFLNLIVLFISLVTMPKRRNT